MATEPTPEDTPNLQPGELPGQAPETAPAPDSDTSPGVEKQHAQNLPPDEMARFVTSIKNPTQQIGEHVLAALQHPNTMAVLTTVVVGPGGQQHLVSAALDPVKVAQINYLLDSAVEQYEDEEACIGFHCLVNPKKGEPPAEGTPPAS